MIDFGVNSTTVSTIYDAVRIGGESSWTKNALLKQQGERRVLTKFPDDPRTRWADWKKNPQNFE
jgi:hypothetical protein